MEGTDWAAVLSARLVPQFSFAFSWWIYPKRNGDFFSVLTRISEQHSPLSEGNCFAFLLARRWEVKLHFLLCCNVPDQDYSQCIVRVKEAFRGQICGCLSGLRCHVFTSWLEVDWAPRCLNGPAQCCHSPSHHTGPGKEQKHELSALEQQHVLEHWSEISDLWPIVCLPLSIS